MSTVTKSGWKVGIYEKGIAAVQARHYVGSGNPGRVLCSLDDALEAGLTRVVMYARASTSQQVDSIPQQMADLDAAVWAHGLEEVGRFEEVCQGGTIARSALLAAIICAEREGAFVLADNSTRVLRHEDFDARCRSSLRASDYQWDDLADFARDVRIATLQHPALENAAIRGSESRRGQTHTGRKGGRPPKPERRACKAIREANRDYVLYLANDVGMSYREIEAETGVRKSTVGRWVGEAT